MKWKFATEGERRFEAKGLHGLQPKNQTIADPFDVFLSSPVVANGAVYFGSGDGNLYALDSATGDLRWKFKAGDVVHASPALAGDVVFIGVLNGTLEARDAKTGELLWDFQVETSKQNTGWVLTADRKFNTPFLFHSSWRESPLLANDQQIRIGGIFSSLLVVNGVVYFGSADGFLYAME